MINSDFVGEGYEDFVKIIPDIKPLVFLPKNQETKHLAIEDREVELDLPFPTVSIEVKDQCLTIPDVDDKLEVSIICFVVHEVAPKDYEYYLYVQMKNKTFSMKMKNKLNGLIVEKFLERLKNESVGSVREKHRCKLKVGKVKTIHKIKDVIYVCPHSYKSELESQSRGPVDWSHSFWVRGHWRKIDGIGKDRQDVRGVDGYTWVSHYIKGDGPLVTKTRLITTKKERTI